MGGRAEGQGRQGAALCLTCQLLLPLEAPPEACQSLGPPTCCTDALLAKMLPLPTFTLVFPPWPPPPWPPPPPPPPPPPRSRRAACAEAGGRAGWAATRTEWSRRRSAKPAPFLPAAAARGMQKTATYAAAAWSPGWGVGALAWLEVGPEEAATLSSPHEAPAFARSDRLSSATPSHLQHSCAKRGRTRVRNHVQDWAALGRPWVGWGQASCPSPPSPSPPALLRHLGEQQTASPAPCQQERRQQEHADGLHCHGSQGSTSATIPTPGLKGTYRGREKMTKTAENEWKMWQSTARPTRYFLQYMAGEE